MERPIYLQLMQDYLRIFPICAILGARQVGKTTLAHQYKNKHAINAIFFDLENPQDLASLDNPITTLSKYNDHLIVIDEIQRKPELFPILRVLVDNPEKTYKFLILGSASKDLIAQSCETLTGRIGYIELPPFTLFDLIQSNTRLLTSSDDIADKLLIQGGFPRSYLAESLQDSFIWRQEYINTFLERDLPNLGFQIVPQVMYRFWMMLCFYHGQICNTKEIAKSLMITDKVTNYYLDILAGTFMIRVLQPWFENIKKRQVKASKIYFRDTGIFNSLLSIRSIQELAKNPKIGPLWEGFALEQIITCFQIPAKNCYFWSTHNEAELDLFILHQGKRIGFEFKYSDAPKITKSMLIAIDDLKLDHLYIIYPGTLQFAMQDKITACGLTALQELTL